MNFNVKLKNIQEKTWRKSLEYRARQNILRLDIKA